MANPEHLAKLKECMQIREKQSEPGKLNEGVKAWNNWRQEHPTVKPDLSRADLTSLDAGDAFPAGMSLQSANLSGANLGGARLMSANFWSANLAGANLAETSLHFANFSGANLVGANLTDAVLFGASLDHAQLDISDMTGADLHMTSFGNNDLRTVMGLDRVEHTGPCTIGLDTIQRSNGKISSGGDHRKALGEIRCLRV